MKRVPLLMATMTAIFIAVCLVQAWTYPIKPPDDWRPAWWQVGFLVELGYWIATPAVYVADLTAQAGGDNQDFHFASFVLPLILTILIAFFIVFHTVKALSLFLAARPKDRGRH